MSCWAVELPLFGHVHRLDSIKNDARATEYLESQHRSNEPLDSTMILLDDVVQIFDQAQLDVAAGVSSNTFDRRGVRTALIDGDLLGHTVETDRALQKPTRCRLVALGGEQEVDCASLATVRR